VDTRAFNILSLCTGGGGLDLGIKLAVPTARVVCCVEHEAYCCEILATRMENKALDDSPVWTDLRTFDGKPWRGVVDCIIGGYPCQPFSVAGKQLGEDDERHLWPDIARIIGEVEPNLCFFENVAGHLSLGADTVFESLERMGYEIAASLFTAAEVGANHKRERLFILANTQRPRLEGTEPAGKIRSNGCSAEYGLPLFPPSPGDLESWQKVLEINPSLEPAICGVADGLAPRVDRLRMLGNGVVPLQAAYAFVSLWAALHGG